MGRPHYATFEYIGGIVGNKLDLFLEAENVDGKDIEALIKEYAESKGFKYKFKYWRDCSIPIRFCVRVILTANYTQRC